LNVLKYPKGKNKKYKCIDIKMKLQPNLFGI